MSPDRLRLLAVWLMLIAAAVLIPVSCAVYVNENYEGTGLAAGGAGGAGVGGGWGGVGGFGCVTEVCDGFDNDCDGLVDEDCPCEPGSQQPCYSGNPATVFIGDCIPGTQACASDGHWGVCNGEVLPGTELCDLSDNDCDGQVNEDCPCEPGSEQPCYTGNQLQVGFGPCRAGTQYCGDDGVLDPTCVGAVGPSQEICNGIDDDCNGLIDLQDPLMRPDLLCPAVPNGTVDCVADACVIASCNTDYSDANGLYADGCECLANPLTSAGATCATAIDLGTLSDLAQDLQNQVGNGGIAGRSVWYHFHATDDVDTAGDEFHVDVRFVANPGSGYVMDFYRGGCAAGNLLHTAEADRCDWYTDINYTDPCPTGGGSCGEGDCTTPPPQLNHNLCDDDTADFYVRIYRPDGVASCESYTLELSNGVH